MVAPAASSFSTAAACRVAVCACASQSGLPAPVFSPAMSYMSLTAALSPASGPLAAPLSGAFRSCGTKNPLIASRLGSAWPRYQSRIFSPLQQATPGFDRISSKVRSTCLMRCGLRRTGYGCTAIDMILARLLRLLVEAIEGIHRAPVELLRRMVLQHHHDDVVQLEIVGQRDHRLVRGLQRHRLVVEHPVADVFDAGLRQIVERVEGLRQAGPEPAARRPAPELADDVDGLLMSPSWSSTLCIGIWS